MRRILTALTALLITSSAYAAFGIFQTYLPTPDPRTQVSLTTYGGVCDGVTDDTAAFVAFKAAWQGSSPVQLNLPGFCTYNPPGGDGAWIFLGVGDLIVQGTGTGTSGIKNISAGNIAFGGKGQVYDNAHSLRTDSANAGDSCVTVKTAPSITISNVAPHVPPVSSFTASATGTTLTVTAVASGTIMPGAVIHNDNQTAGYFTTIQPYGTGGTTGVGGTGTYALSQTTSFTSRPAYTSQATFTASVDAAGVMTVTAIAEGTLVPGLNLFANGGPYGGTGGDATGITIIQSQLTGSAGGTGTYQLSNVNPNGAVSSRQWQAAGFIRLTVNSTAGLTSGDTLYVSGVVGPGGLSQRTNGLKWIKVVDATHIDLFQWSFEGAYTSGGVAGGDRTSLTPPGSKVMMSGYALQSYWGGPYGDPTNQHWFEWLTVASTNSTTHQVCFTTPLVNSYKDTWPQYNTGSPFRSDPGGPATLYAIDSTWELVHVYKDFTLDNPNFQTGSGGRTVTWNNVATTGAHCLIPSQNETYTWININASGCNIETDKLVGTWEVNGSQINNLTVQSSSMGLINVTNGSVINQLAGTPKTFSSDNSSYVCSGCASTVAGTIIGTTAYGSTSEVTLTNSSIANTIGHTGALQRVDLPGQQWSMSGGVITIPNSYSWNPCCNASEMQSRSLVPGNYGVWEGSGGGGANAQTGRAFKIVDVTQDLDNTYIQTSESGGFPTGAWTTNGLSVRAHPAPKLTTSGNTGGVGVDLFNGCPAQSPMFSCANYSRTGGAAGTTPASGISAPRLWGELDTFTFTNNVPYTGAGTLTWSAAQFTTIAYLNTSNVQTLTNFIVNMKLPTSCGSCTRTLTPSGLTNGQVGDTLSAPPAGAVFGGTFGLSVFSANTPSDSPQVTITLRTNQNLPP